VKIWTDGSIDKNPGTIGGWAYLIKFEHFEIRNSGSCQYDGVTNNHTEIQAVIHALKDIQRFSSFVFFPIDMIVNVISDSQYVINQAERKWKRKFNLTLLDLLDVTIQRCQYPIKFSWVRGHSGVLENEIVDNLAGLEVKNIQLKRLVR